MLVEPLLISLKNKELVKRLNRISRQGENK